MVAAPVAGAKVAPVPVREVGLTKVYDQTGNGNHAYIGQGRIYALNRTTGQRQLIGNARLRFDGAIIED